MRRKALLLVVAACIFILAQLYGYAHKLTHLQNDLPFAECLLCDQLIASDDHALQAVIFIGVLLALYFAYTSVLTERLFFIRIASPARSPPAI